MDGAMRFEARLSMALPPGWFAKESVTLLAPDGSANVIASSEPLDPSIDTDRYAEVQGGLLRREFPHYQELWFGRMAVLGGLPGVQREFTWTPPDGVPVTQLQWYFAQAGRGYTATATTPSSSFSRLEPALRHVLGGVRVASAAAAAPPAAAE